MQVTVKRHSDSDKKTSGYLSTFLYLCKESYTNQCKKGVTQIKLLKYNARLVVPTVVLVKNSDVQE
jgi:hypothetical protein